MTVEYYLQLMAEVRKYALAISHTEDGGCDYKLFKLQFLYVIIEKLYIAEV